MKVLNNKVPFISREIIRIDAWGNFPLLYWSFTDLEEQKQSFKNGGGIPRYAPRGRGG